MPKEKLNFPGVGTKLEIEDRNVDFEIKIIKIDDSYCALNLGTNNVEHFNNEYYFDSITDLLEALTKIGWQIYVITN